MVKNMPSRCKTCPRVAKYALVLQIMPSCCKIYPHAANYALMLQNWQHALQGQMLYNSLVYLE